MSAASERAEALAAFLALRSADPPADARALTRARNAVVLANLGLVRREVTRYARGRESLTADDLFAEGVLGLLRTLEVYDPTRGASFATVAIPWIRQAIACAVHNTDRLVRLPSHLEASLRGAANAQRTHLAQTGEWLDADGLASRVDLSPVQLARVLAVSTSAPSSLDATRTTADEAGESTLHDLLADTSAAPTDAGLDARDRRDVVGPWLRDLSARERAVLGARYGVDDPQLADVGVALGLTRERVRSIEASALRKLRRRAEMGADRAAE